MTRVLVGLLMSLSAVAIAAEPIELYESFDELALGRVFLTPTQRQRLEVRRRTATADVVGSVSDDNTEPAAATAAPKPAAGYILRQSGQPLVWLDGEFRRTDASSIAAMRFPGAADVRIDVGSDVALDAVDSSSVPEGDRPEDPDTSAPMEADDARAQE